MMRSIKIKIVFKIIPAVWLLLTAGRSVAGDTGRGGYAGSFLRMGLGARAMAMGGGSSAVLNDAFSAYYNPAGLVFLNRRYAATSYNSMSLDRHLFYAGYAHAMGGNKRGLPRVGLSVGWLSAGVNEIDGRDFDGNHTTMYSASENAFFLAFAFHPVRQLAIGLTGKILYNRFPDLIGDGESMSATGVAFDLGVMVQPLFFLSIGLTFKDLQGKVTWDSQELYDRGTQTVDRLLSGIRGGVAGSFFQEKLTVFTEFEKTDFWPVVFSCGVEVQPLEGFWVRSGLWRWQFTFGGGYRFHVWKIGAQLDYAYVPDTITPRGNHIFTWSFIF